MTVPNHPQALRSSLDLGRRLRDQRLRLGLTQAQLAAKAGLTQPAISRVERGLGLGSLEQLLSLLNALGLELALQPADLPPAGGNSHVS
jgi:transcriptional regulator with XRE-family HTH domain